MRLLQISAVWLSLLCWLSWSLAGAADLPDASDPSQLMRYPGAYISGFNRTQAAQQRLPLGPIKRVGRELRLDASRRLVAERTQVTYRMPDESDLQEVFDHYRRRVEGGRGEVLFLCQGRSCGSSNSWANQIFHIPTLYGPEDSQRLLVAAFEEESAYLLVYAIRRGTRRLFVHLEWFALSGEQPDLLPDAATLGAQLKRQGYLPLTWLKFSAADQLLNPEALQTLADLWQGNAGLRVYLVGHLQGDADLPDLLERSRQRAEAVSLELYELGIATDRIQPRGLGPLAPSGGEDRIELVVRRD